MTYSAGNYSFEIANNEGDHSEINFFFNNNEIGRVEIEKDGYDANISYFEIYEDFRGNGHYKNVLASLISSEILDNEMDCDCLVSNFRIESNLAYNHWFATELNKRTSITIQFDEDEKELRLSCLESEEDITLNIN